MDDLYAILKTWSGLEESNREAVLATVVHVTRSAYRRPGARMLITSDGRRIGSVSGGCLEGEITRKAWWFTESGSPVVRVYDTSSDEDAVWEFGLGCNGIVHVMLERAGSAGTADLFRFLERNRSSHRSVVVATVVRVESNTDVSVGDRLYLEDDGGFSGALVQRDIASDLIPHQRTVQSLRQSRMVHLGYADVFVEWIGAPQSLVIFGAGHDAEPVVQIASALGWRVTVADGRPAYARRDRFPSAEHVVVMSGTDLFRDVTVDSDAAAIVMTHNITMDVRLITELLVRQPKYLGLLGPRSRAQKLFAELAISMPDYVHAPAGLDIGANDPAATALSIVSEIQTVVTGRNGGMLKHRKGPIHLPSVEIGAVSQTFQTDRPSFCESMAGNNG